MPPSGQELIKNLFDYVIAYTQIKTPCARNIVQQPWSQYLGDVPKHETIQFTPPSASDAASGRVLLKVGRAKLNDPPVPPEILLEWLEAAETWPVAIGSFGAGAGGMRGRNPNAPPAPITAAIMAITTIRTASALPYCSSRRARTRLLQTVWLRYSAKLGRLELQTREACRDTE